MVNQFLQLNGSLQSGIFRLLDDVLAGETSVMECVTGGIQNAGDGLMNLSEEITDLTLHYTDLGISSSIDIVDYINRFVVDVLVQITNLIQDAFGEAYQGVGDSLTVGVSLANEVAGSWYNSGRIVASTILDLSQYATNAVFDLFIRVAQDVEAGCNYAFDVTDTAVDGLVGLDQLKPSGKLAIQSGRGAMTYITNLSAKVLSMVQEFLNHGFTQSQDIQNMVFDGLIHGTGLTFEMFQKIGFTSSGTGMRLNAAFMEFFHKTFAGVATANALFWNSARETNRIVFDFLNGGKAFAFPACRTMWTRGHDTIRDSMRFALGLIDTGLRSSIQICEAGRAIIMDNVDNCIVNIWDLVFRVFENIYGTACNVGLCAEKCFHITDNINILRRCDVLAIEETVVTPVFDIVRRADQNITEGIIFDRFDGVMGAMRGSGKAAPKKVEAKKARALPESSKPAARHTQA